MSGETWRGVIHIIIRPPMDAAAFAGQVDRLHKSGQSGHELIARTGVDLPIGFGIGWIRSGRVQKLVAPVPCDAGLQPAFVVIGDRIRSEEHTSELQSLMRISYAVFCLKKK